MKVYFDFDQSSINKSSKTSLDSLAVVLKKYYKFSLQVNGFTDQTGNFEYNKNLAIKRATEVYSYLKNSGLSESNFNYVGGGNTESDTKLSDAKKRNCTILLDLNDEDKIYREKNFTSQSGSIVTANVKSNIDIEVSDFFSNESMLENEMFAVDSDGNILQTAGMIEIKISGNLIDAIDGEINVKMPIQNEDTFDNQMTLWEEVLDEQGKTKWKETNIKLTKDKTGKNYEFNVPSRGNSSVRYNLDKPTYSINKRSNKKFQNEVIYLQTYKNFHFTDINLSDRKIKFATKINDSVYAFVRPFKRSLRQLVFKGVINDSVSKDIPFVANLDYARYKVERGTGVKTFTICEKCNYFINNEEKNKKTKPAEETGIWAWIKRLFS